MLVIELFVSDFDGTLVPLTVSVLAFVGLALILVLMIDESETPD